MPEITSAPQSSVPASIASPTLTPTVVETSEKLPTKDSPNRVKSGTGKAPTVKRIRQTPEGLAIEDQLVQSLPSVKGSEKVVFRAPNISGNQSELQPLKIEPAPGSPLIAKPSTAPKDSDCGCGNKK
ncbi:MAG: hypothetical protein LBE12_21110 [Planctomycetaceae bacterium]|nr:hypothetical protein [Planctomycetaceae bacterium]